LGNTTGQDAEGRGDLRPEPWLRRAPPDHLAFCECADPGAYLARDATESALVALEACVMGATGTGVLTGAPGMGKSSLLRVLGQRLDEWAFVVYLPYGAMSPADLCEWILGITGEGVAQGENPVDALRGYARMLRREGLFLAVLIDDADSLPLETARMVGGWIGESGGDICPVLAACEGERTEQVLAAVGPYLRRVSLDEPMDARETELYVGHALERAGVTTEFRDRFDPATLDWIVELSEGVPRLVNELALRVIDTQLGNFETDWSEDTWLGPGDVELLS
jgi:type II secretory pathway predicted ATPase ExeA